MGQHNARNLLPLHASMTFVLIVLSACALPAGGTRTAEIGQTSDIGATPGETLSDSRPIDSQNPGIRLDVTELETFSTIHDLARSSDVVVVASVVDVRPGRVVDDSGIEGEDALQILDVTLAVEEALVGEPADTEVAIEWMGWEIDGATGEPGSPFVVSGIPTPNQGDRAVWFLRREDGDHRGTPRYGLVSLDGLLLVRGDGTLVSPLDDPTRLAHSLDGTTVDELRKLLATGS